MNVTGTRTRQQYMDLLPRRSKLSVTSAFAGDSVVTRELNKSKSSSTLALVPPFVIELVPESNPPKPACWVGTGDPPQGELAEAPDEGTGVPQGSPAAGAVNKILSC